jgi:hypothetical protein
VLPADKKVSLESASPYLLPMLNGQPAIKGVGRGHEKLIGKNSAFWTVDRQLVSYHSVTAEWATNRNY